MKKTKNKKIKKVIFILLLILLIIFLLIKFIEKKPEKYQVPRGNYIENSDNEKYLEERVILRNIMLLNQYKGNVKRDSLYVKLNGLTNFIIDFNNNDNKSISEFFKENEKNIKSLFGNNISIEKFELIAKKINMNGIKNLKYAEIVKDSINILDNAFSFEISLNFVNEQKINFNVYIKNESTGIDEDIIFEVM